MRFFGNLKLYDVIIYETVLLKVAGSMPTHVKDLCACMRYMYLQKRIYACLHIVYYP